MRAIKTAAAVKAENKTGKKSLYMHNKEHWLL